MIDFLEHIGPGTHCLAVCQPCVPALMAVAAMAMDDNPARPASLMLMAGPVDARVRATTTLALVRQQGLPWFENNVVDKVPVAYAGRGRRVYSGFRQLSVFSSWRSADHIHRHLQFYRDLVIGNKKRAAEHRAFYDNYMAVMDIPAEFYLDTLERVFGDQKLAKGTSTFEGRRLDLSAITDVPLMTVEGGKDDATPIGQTSAAHNLCTGLTREQRTMHVQPDVGHYGVFSGSRFRSHIAPKLVRFMRTHPPR